MDRQTAKKRNTGELLKDAVAAFNRHRKLIIFFAATHVVFLLLGQWMTLNEMPGAIFIRSEELKIIKDAGLAQAGAGSEAFILRVGASFLLNLVFGAFVYSTASGIVFFLPYVIAVWRAFLIGILVYGQLDWSIKTIAFYLIFMLEFGAYSISSVAGTDFGLTILWPGRRKGLERGQALRESFNDGVNLYVIVIIMLLVSTFLEFLFEGYFGPFIDFSGLK
ncbi:MAG: hypothetical protein OEV28_13365 [Nitrospirota bacterium]|nr:hypothetical protein [Nitrospirota bacterium]